MTEEIDDIELEWLITKAELLEAKIDLLVLRRELQV